MALEKSGLSLSGQSLPGPSQRGQLFWRPCWWPENRFPWQEACKAESWKQGRPHTQILQQLSYPLSFHRDPTHTKRSVSAASCPFLLLLFFYFRGNLEKVLKDMNTQ